MFENLDVYQAAIEFVDRTYTLCDNLKRGYLFKIIDQLQRASLSIPLNIAEGCGRSSKKERRQFYKISRGSLFECIPILTILNKRGNLPKGDFLVMYDLATRIGMMLNGLISSLDKYEETKS